MPGHRQRLSPQQRREQLLEIGARLFGERPYEQVWIEEVAERAGVSRGLLYHYFPTKRDFFAAVIAAASARLPGLADLDPSLAPAERLTEGLEQFLTYIEAHEHSYRALHRGAGVADADLHALVEQDNAELERRILAGLGVDDRDAEHREVVALAVRGWLAFVIATCLDWLDHRSVTRDQLRDLCVRALLGAVAVPGPDGSRAG